MPTDTAPSAKANKRMIVQTRSCRSNFFVTALLPRPTVRAFPLAWPGTLVRVDVRPWHCSAGTAERGAYAQRRAGYVVMQSGLMVSDRSWRAFPLSHEGECSAGIDGK